MIDAGDEDLGAEPPRLLQRPARQLVARDAGREAEVVLDPRRRAGLAAGRLPLDRRSCAAPPTRRRRPRRARPGRRRRPRCRTRRRRARWRGRAARRRGAAAAARRVLPSTTRIAGQSSSAGQRRRPSCSAASGASGVIHLNVIWLRSRKRRSSVQAGIPAVADHDRARRRRLGGDALQPARRRRCGRRRACRPPSRRRARPPRARGSRAARSAARATARAARNPTGKTVPSAIGTSPKRSPASRSPTTRSIAVDELDRLDRAVEHREERALAALVRGVLAGRERDVGRSAREPLAVGLGRGRRRSRSTAISSAVTMRRAYPRGVAELQRPSEPGNSRRVGR